MWYQPGDVVSVRTRSGIRHEGIMTETGRVISNSRRRGGVYEESFRSFADGGKVINHGPRNRLDSDIVLARARARSGKNYNPYSYNCEHFVREVYGERRHSPQKKIVLGLAAVAAMLIAI